MRKFLSEKFKQRDILEAMSNWKDNIETDLQYKDTGGFRPNSFDSE